MRFLRNEMLLFLAGTAIHKKQMTSSESSVHLKMWSHIDPSSG